MTSLDTHPDTHPDSRPDSRPDWARRIRTERVGRRWSQEDAVRAMAAHGGTAPRTSLLRQWKRWEAGDVYPGAHHQRLIARTFGIPTALLFPPDPVPTGRADVGSLEILARMRTSDLDPATLDTLEAAVDELGCSYGREPTELHAEGHRWLTRLTDMLDRRLTLAQHRDILSLAGRVALLVGCVEYDLGQAAAAEATRRAALSLGEESGDAHIVGWAYEMRAWYDLTQGRYWAAVQAATAGMDAVGPQHSVGVQLAAHRAKAWARMGDRREVEVALSAGRTLLEALPFPSNPQNHFVIDPSKWDFYTMDAYRHVGEDGLAQAYADEVIRTGTTADGTVVRPMRVAEAHITRGVVAARQGDLDGALVEARAGLGLSRKSLPSLVMNARELVDVMRDRFGEDPAVARFDSELRALAA